MAESWQAEFDERGYTILRGVIDGQDIDRARQLSDRLWHAWREGKRVEGLEEARVLERDREDLGKTLDAIQGGYKGFPELQALRKNSAILKLLEPRLGTELVSVVDTLFFKPPNQPDTGIAYHRDAQFRRPAEKFRDLETKYVQIGFPLEKHGHENGGLVLIPHSHKDPSIDAVQTKSVRGTGDLSDTLSIDASQAECAEMQPGDLVLWHPYTIHGSNPNRSTEQSRRFYVVGYMAATSCDAGVAV